MLLIDTLPLGAYQTNCYIVRAQQSRTCAVIDPGYDGETILAHLAKQDLILDAILLTHGHFDHVGAVETLIKKTGCRLWLNQGDYTMEKNPVNDRLYPLHDTDSFEIFFCEEGEHIQAGGLTFHTITTPGHTWGSVCYLCEDAMFSGDTLFAGSCGRTDLPGADPRSMRESLTRLAQLEDNLRIFPGHGPATTFSHEKQTNPYLRGFL